MRVYLRVRKGQLSQKSIEKGKQKKDSLFLMYHDGEQNIREYEFLKLYIYSKPKNELQKLHNKETWQLAQSIHAQKVIDLQTTRHGFVSSIRGKVGILTYFKTLVDKRFDAGAGNYGNWASAYKHLKKFCKNVNIPIEKIDELFLENFKTFLLTAKINHQPKNTPLHQNTAMSYFNKLRTALREAFLNKMIKENPCLRVKCIKELEAHRQFLTLEELQLLVKTECKDPLMKRAFIFSALTGLRYSDVSSLKWKNIKHDDINGWALHYTQQKTKNIEVLPVGESAIKILGERKYNELLVFDGLVYNAYQNRLISKWVKAAGIDKHITFHCARHSFATLQLTMNTDIFTVSKLLGHKNLKTTQIYAKVIDKKKIEAAARMPNLDF